MYFIIFCDQVHAIIVVWDAISHQSATAILNLHIIDVKTVPVETLICTTSLILLPCEWCVCFTCMITSFSMEYFLKLNMQASLPLVKEARKFVELFKILVKIWSFSLREHQIFVICHLNALYSTTYHQLVMHVALLRWIALKIPLNYHGNLFVLFCARALTWIHNKPKTYILMIKKCTNCLSDNTNTSCWIVDICRMLFKRKRLISDTIKFNMNSLNIYIYIVICKLLLLSLTLTNSFSGGQVQHWCNECISKLFIYNI